MIAKEYVASVLQTAVQSEVVSHVLEGQRRFDLLVRFEKSIAMTMPIWGRLRIDLPPSQNYADRGQVELH